MNTSWAYEHEHEQMSFEVYVRVINFKIILSLIGEVREMRNIYKINTIHCEDKKQKDNSQRRTVK